MKKIYIIMAGIILTVLLMNITGFTNNSDSNNTEKKQELVGYQKDKHTIYFAGGCFWGTEHFFKQVRGVISTEVGYANGHVENPSYRQVTTGKTGFTETVKVVYDPKILGLDMLMDLYLKTIDPTSLNKQGNDIGTQYRTGVYFTDPKDEAIINSKLQDIAKNYSSKIQVEVSKIQNFYDAEGYHQDYLDKNPNGYCHIDPSLFEYAKKANPKK